MNTNDRSAPLCSGASAPDTVASEEDEERTRFRLACYILHTGVPFPSQPGQRRNESAIDWLVRIGIAADPRRAAEALVVAKFGRHGLDRIKELHAELGLYPFNQPIED